MQTPSSLPAGTAAVAAADGFVVALSPIGQADESPADGAHFKEKLQAAKQRGADTATSVTPTRHADRTASGPPPTSAAAALPESSSATAAAPAASPAAVELTPLQRALRTLQRGCAFTSFSQSDAPSPPARSKILLWLNQRPRPLGAPVDTTAAAIGAGALFWCPLSASGCPQRKWESPRRRIDIAALQDLFMGRQVGCFLHPTIAALDLPEDCCCSLVASTPAATGRSDSSNTGTVQLDLLAENAAAFRDWMDALNVLFAASPTELADAAASSNSTASAVTHAAVPLGATGQPDGGLRLSATSSSESSDLRLLHQLAGFASSASESLGQWCLARMREGVRVQLYCSREAQAPTAERYFLRLVSGGSLPESIVAARCELDEQQLTGGESKKESTLPIRLPVSDMTEATWGASSGVWSEEVDAAAPALPTCLHARCLSFMAAVPSATSATNTSLDVEFDSLAHLLIWLIGLGFWRGHKEHPPSAAASGTSLALKPPAIQIFPTELRNAVLKLTRSVEVAILAARWQPSVQFLEDADHQAMQLLRRGIRLHALANSSALVGAAVTCSRVYVQWRFDNTSADSRFGSLYWSSGGSVDGDSSVKDAQRLEIAHLEALLRGDINSRTEAAHVEADVFFAAHARDVAAVLQGQPSSSLPAQTLSLIGREDSLHLAWSRTMAAADSTAPSLDEWLDALTRLLAMAGRGLVVDATSGDRACWLSVTGGSASAHSINSAGIEECLSPTYSPLGRLQLASPRRRSDESARSGLIDDTLTGHLVNETETELAGVPYELPEAAAGSRSRSTSGPSRSPASQLLTIITPPDTMSLAELLSPVSSLRNGHRFLLLQPARVGGIDVARYVRMSLHFIDATKLRELLGVTGDNEGCTWLQRFPSAFPAHCLPRSNEHFSGCLYWRPLSNIAAGGSSTSPLDTPLSASDLRAEHCLPLHCITDLYVGRETALLRSAAGSDLSEESCFSLVSPSVEWNVSALADGNRARQVVDQVLQALMRLLQSSGKELEGEGAPVAATTNGVSNGATGAVASDSAAAQRTPIQNASPAMPLRRRTSVAPPMLIPPQDEGVIRTPFDASSDGPPPQYPSPMPRSASATAYALSSSRSMRERTGSTSVAAEEQRNRGVGGLLPCPQSPTMAHLLSDDASFDSILSALTDPRLKQDHALHARAVGLLHQHIVTARKQPQRKLSDKATPPTRNRAVVEQQIDTNAIRSLIEQGAATQIVDSMLTFRRVESLVIAGSASLCALCATESDVSALWSAGAVGAVVSAMASLTETADVIIEGARALQALSCSPSYAERMGDAGGVEAVLGGIKCHAHDERVCKAGIAALASMLVVQSNRAHFVALGGVDQLLAALRLFPSTLDLHLSGLSCMRLLAGHSADLKSRLVSHGALDFFVTDMHRFKSSHEVQRRAAAALAGLAAGSDTQIKLLSVHQGGVTAVLRALKRHGQDEGLVAECCSALRHISAAREARAPLSAAGAAAAAIDALVGFPSSPSIAENCASVLLHLSDSDAHAEEIVQLQGATALLATLRAFLHEASVVDACCGALWLLTRAPSVRTALVPAEVIALAEAALCEHAANGALVQRATGMRLAWKALAREMRA